MRVKRLRNPDVVSLERLEHFLKSSEAVGITVILAGIRPDLLQALAGLRFVDWYPEDRIFPQGSDEDSATLAAIRGVYRRLGNANECEHCAPKHAARRTNSKLYYLV